jgi:hypothetical protein
MPKIEKKIVGWAIKSNEPPAQEPVTLEKMHDALVRPEILLGSTYKIKPPIAEVAMYLTINDMVLNEETEHEKRHPYECFINSKNMEHYQWVTALTRVLSAIFRKSNDLSFLVEELKGIFDPKGGHFKKGGVFCPSLVAEIGYALEQHLLKIGHIAPMKLTHAQKEFIAAKRKEFEEKNSTQGDESFPTQAILCSKCNVKALVLMDGCMTCLNCGDSKCG